MAVDILKYTALNAKTQCLQAENVAATYGSVQSKIMTSNGAALSCYTLIGCSPPLISGTSLCVYDSSGWTAGACCLWTVPAGATTVQFQIWGAGAGSGSWYCCGGSPFGSSGAYAIVQIPAVVGCQYTLCAGCAAMCCAWAWGGINPQDGCASYVSGYGLTGFCADGGCACSLMLQACCLTNQFSYVSVAGTSTPGSIICQYNSWNGTTTCCSGGWVTNVYTPRTYHGSSSTSTYGIFGVPSMTGCICIDSSQYGYHYSPPTISPSHTINSPIFISTSSTCSGCGWCLTCTSASFCSFGMGGMPSSQFAGATSQSCTSGMPGRTGGVIVTYC